MTEWMTTSTRPRARSPKGTRRLTRLSLALASLVALLAFSFNAAAQDEEATPTPTPETSGTRIISTQVGEVPTTGGMRPGPIGLEPPAVALQTGVVPVAIQVDAAEINASIEILEIVDGVMQDPTGPWVVSWYKETSKLGGGGNIVMAGHVDYWDVGPSVFWNLRNLAQGDQIVVTGEDGSAHTYEVEWIENFDADNAPIAEIVGPTDRESLTLITCGGPFDYESGHYLQRTVVRANLVAT
jgi:sortase A